MRCGETADARRSIIGRKQVRSARACGAPAVAADVCICVIHSPGGMWRARGSWRSRYCNLWQSRVQAGILTATVMPRTHPASSARYGSRPYPASYSPRRSTVRARKPAVPLQGAIRLDGRLTNPFWQQAPRRHRHRCGKSSHTPVSRRRSAPRCDSHADEAAIYVGRAHVR